jgi:ribosomal protein L7/L12
VSKTKVLCYRNTRNKTEKAIKLVRERVKVAFRNASFVFEGTNVSVSRDMRQSKAERSKRKKDGKT